MLKRWNHVSEAPGFVTVSNEGVRYDNHKISKHFPAVSRWSLQDNDQFVDYCIYDFQKNGFTSLDSRERVLQTVHLCPKLAFHSWFNLFSFTLTETSV